MQHGPVAGATRHSSLPAFLFALLAIIVVGACGNPPSPSPTASPIASASIAPPSASSSAGNAPCAAADVTATGGPWGGAAGSRGSDVVVSNHGSAACVLPAGPTVALVDQAGTVLLSNTPPAAGTGPSLAPGGTIGFSLVMSNWCEQQVTFPLHLSLALAAGSVDIGDLSVSSVDDLPPCNGPGQPAALSATAWEPA